MTTATTPVIVNSRIREEWKTGNSCDKKSVPAISCSNSHSIFGLQWHPNFFTFIFSTPISWVCYEGIRKVPPLSLYREKNLSQFNFYVLWDQEANIERWTDLPGNNFGQPFPIPKFKHVGGQVQTGNVKDSRFVIKLFRLTKLAVNLLLPLCLHFVFVSSYCTCK